MQPTTETRCWCDSSRSYPAMTNSFSALSWASILPPKTQTAEAMHDDVYLSLALPLLAGPLAHLIATRVGPRQATILMTVAAVALSVTSCAALGIVVAAGIAGPTGGGATLATLASRAPGAIGAAALGAAALGAALLATARFILMRCRALNDAFRHARSLPSTGAVIVTSPTADAYTVPGAPGRIVVSTGMVAALDEPSLRALIAHEQAHLDCSHYVYATLARLAATANPFVRPLATAVGYSIERWADEEAATVTGDRLAVARAISSAAVAAKHGHAQAEHGIMLGALGSGSSTDLSGAGPIPRRVAALLTPPRPTSTTALGLGAWVIAASLAFSLEAASDLTDAFPALWTALT